jgi:hypothetical protein
MPTPSRIFQTVEAPICSRGRRVRRGCVGSPRWNSRWPGVRPGRGGQLEWRVGRVARAGWASGG